MTWFLFFFFYKFEEKLQGNRRRASGSIVYCISFFFGFRRKSREDTATKPLLRHSRTKEKKTKTKTKYKKRDLDSTGIIVLSFFFWREGEFVQGPTECVWERDMWLGQKLAFNYKQWYRRNIPIYFKEQKKQLINKNNAEISNIHEYFFPLQNRFCPMEYYEISSAKK